MALILVIDDDPSCRAVCKAMLRHTGHEVCEAGSGSEGLRRCAERRPDAVVLDMYMPERDGIEVMGDLRKLDSTIPIIAVSGGGAAHDLAILRPASMLGAEGSLLKPFSREQLLAAVEAVLA